MGDPSSENAAPVDKSSPKAPNVTGAITDRDKIDYAPKGENSQTFKYYPENPESGMNKLMFAIKGPSEYYDPCQESAQMSLNCLDRNDYNRDMCKEYFDAYRECKKQWLRARREDRTQWE